MRAIWISRYGKAEVLEVREGPDPEPREGEVRIRVRAAGLNFAEVMARQGLYPDAPKPPCVVGYEIAGEVDALGTGVEKPAVGTRVMSLVNFGGHADLVCVPSTQVIEMPQEMSFEEAAAMPVNYVTAYHMLFEVYRLRREEHVLVHMAAGGVGTAALQLCKTVAGTVTYGTSSASKHPHLLAEGCTHPIDYRSKDYKQEVLEHTKGRGVDLVLDPLGGADWKKGYELLRPGGMLIAFGWANMNRGKTRSVRRVIGQALGLPWATPLRLMNDNKSVAGVHLGHLQNETALLQRHVEKLLNLYAQEKIKPHVHATFPFEEAAEAHRILEEGANTGKVVLIP